MLACSYAAAAENDFRCLVSIGLKKPLRLQFVFPADDRSTGRVVYQAGSGPIPIKKIETKTVRDVPGGRPSVFATEWEEVTKDGTGGKYIVTIQGARIYEFKYVRKQDGRVFNFEEDLDATGDKECEWDEK